MSCSRRFEVAAAVEGSILLAFVVLLFWFGNYNLREDVEIMQLRNPSNISQVVPICAVNCL